MIRKAAFLAFALFTGTASAAPIATSIDFTKNANIAYSAKLPEVQKDSVTVGFNFSFTGNVENNDFLGFYFGTSGNMSEAYKGPNFGFKANCGNGAKSCTNDLFVRTTGTDGVYVPNSDLKAGVTYHLFAHMYKADGSDTYNRFDMWLNPTQEQMWSLTGAHATAKDISALTSFDTVAFRTANIDKGLALRVTDLRVNDVPEPGSLALMGLALAGLAAARRKRA